MILETPLDRATLQQTAADALLLLRQALWQASLDNQVQAKIYDLITAYANAPSQQIMRAATVDALVYRSTTSPLALTITHGPTGQVLYDLEAQYIVPGPWYTAFLAQHQGALNRLTQRALDRRRAQEAQTVAEWTDKLTYKEVSDVDRAA